MKTKLIITVTVLMFSILSHAQDSFRFFYAEGLMDGKMKVTMVGTSNVWDCTAETYYTVMYKYDNVSNWLLLDVDHDGKNNFSMVEYGFTGLMILKETPKNFNGIWISPDQKRQLKVNFEKKKVSEAQQERLIQILEDLNYSYNDC